MVKRIINIIGKEINGLHQAAYLLGFFAILSQVLALFRDRILASSFGAGESLDLYYSAFRIPDVVFATVASIVSASVLIPFIVKKIDEGDEKLKEFVNSIWTFYCLVITIFSVIAFFFTPLILKYIFPKFFEDPAKFTTLVSMTRILLLSPIFLGLSNLFSSLSQVYKRFFVYAISPILYNVGIIFGILVLYPKWGLIGLAIGVSFGAFLHFFIQILFVVLKGFKLEFIKPNLRAIKEVIFVSLPRTVTLSSSELAELFMISFASFLVVGSISVFNFSFNLQSVPYSIIGISYSLAAFPTLSRLFSRGERGQFLEHMITTSRHIIFWSVPVTVLFVVLRAQIVRVLLGAGRFNWEDTRLTAACLAIWTISLVAQNLSTLFVRSFYSRGKTKEPLYINVVGAILIIVSSYILVYIFQHNPTFAYFIESIFRVNDIPGTVVLMLPLGYSIGMILTLLFHLVSFEKEFRSFIASIFKTFLHIFGSSVIAGFFIHIFLDIFDNIFNLDTLLGVFMQGFISGILGIIIAILVLIILQNQELKDIWRSLHQKIWKAKIIPPDASL